MNQVKTTLLLGVLTGLFLVIGGAVGGQRGMLFALAMAAVMNFVSYFFSDKLALAAYGAQPVTQAEAPQLYAIVQRLASKAAIPMPRLYVVDSPALNAFATGRNPAHAAVAAATGILQAMNAEDLGGRAPPRALARPESRHPDVLGRRDARGRTDIPDAFRLLHAQGGDRDDRRGGPMALLAIVLAPDCGDADPARRQPQPRVRRGRLGAKLVGDPRRLADALRKLGSPQAQAIPLEGATPTNAHLCIVSPLSAGGLAGLFFDAPAARGTDPAPARDARLMPAEAGRAESASSDARGGFASGSLRDSVCDRRRRHGGGLPGARRAAEAGRRDQGPAGDVLAGRGPAAALRAGGADRRRR